MAMSILQDHHNFPPCLHLSLPVVNLIFLSILTLLDNLTILFANW